MPQPLYGRNRRAVRAKDTRLEMEQDRHCRRGAASRRAAGPSGGRSGPGGRVGLRSDYRAAAEGRASDLNMAEPMDGTLRGGREARGVTERLGGRLARWGL